jgi:hypothetical protein
VADILRVRSVPHIVTERESVVATLGFCAVVAGHKYEMILKMVIILWSLGILLYLSTPQFYVYWLLATIAATGHVARLQLRF